MKHSSGVETLKKMVKENNGSSPSVAKDHSGTVPVEFNVHLRDNVKYNGEVNIQFCSNKDGNVL